MLHRDKLLVMLLVLSGIQKSENETLYDDDCPVIIQSRGTRRVDQSQLDLLKKTSSECGEGRLRLAYVRMGEFDPTGEALSDLREMIVPSIDPKSFASPIYLRIFETKGFSVDFQLPSLGKEIFFHLMIFEIDFMLLEQDGQPLSDLSCDSSAITPFDTQKSCDLFFRKNIRYYGNTCQLIFNKANIRKLSFTQLADSKIKQNILTFRPTNKTLNSTVSIFSLVGYQTRFDSNIFPLATFSQTKMLSLDGTVSSFTASALNQTALEEIDLATSRLKRFLHNNPSWLNQANLRKSERILIVKISDPQNVYGNYSYTADIAYITWIESQQENVFEDSSFCIFYQIELYSLRVKLAGNVIERWARHNCTCLLFWIIRYHWVRNDLSAEYYSDLGLCVEEKVQMRCQFDKMAQRCSIETIEPLNYRTVYDTALDLEFAKYLADVWLTPVSSVLGIIANFLVIRTFRKIKRSPEYRRNKLQDKSRNMWEYTYYNSWFILFHSLIFACSPLTTCIEIDGIYCPEFVLTQLSRQFYLFVVSFFGNTFRLAANISNTLFVLYRFGVNTEKLNRFRRTKPLRMIVFSLFLSLLLSLITLFMNERFTIEYLWQDSYKYLLASHFGLIKSNLFLKILYLLNMLMGTTIFSMTNMIIDLRLLFYLRKQNSKRPKEDVENRITKMVILNGLFSFLFRSPEMISASLLLVFTFNTKLFPVCFVSESRDHSVCPMLFDISRFLLTITHLENLVLLYLFNPNFQKHLLNSSK
nr:G protein-coupled receptor [Proales similis]